jgi:NAD(P)-dependent dehydrogenase (short-subunit alcohol dehydrogenase family)
MGLKNMPDNELAGRVAVITGAGRSIGREMAIELASAGCAVVVNVRSNRAEAEGVVKAIEAKGGRAIVAVADVVDAAAVNTMAKAALEKFGRIDYLINNAALRQEKSIEHMTFEDWRYITGVVLDGAFHCVKACLGAIKQSDAGSIINVGGLTGAMGAPDRVHVVTAKAGLAGFTRGLARELAPHKITVNTLVPAMLAKPDKPNEIPPHPVYRPLLGRAAWPSDFAPLARFLLGPGARYITGQIINVNGGTHFNA